MVTKYREYKSIIKQIQDSKELLQTEDDDEFCQMLEEELDHLEERKKVVEQELKILLLPRDPNDEKSVIMEIRAGTGEKKPHCLQPTYSACIPDLLKNRAGKLTSWIPTIQI